MSFQDDKESRRRRKPDSPEMIKPTPPSAKKRRSHVSPVGEALKSVYQRTIDEDIPPEMLDLLGKLG